jgi:hypothetical protein
VQKGCFVQYSKEPEFPSLAAPVDTESEDAWSLSILADLLEVSPMEVAAAVKMVGSTVAAVSKYIELWQDAGDWWH